MPRISSSSSVAVLVSVCAILLQAGVFPASAAKAGTRTHRAPKQVRQQIDELEEQFRAATLSGDVAAMDRLLSDDYVGIAWTGQVNTKARQLERIRQHALVLSRMDVSDIKVKLLGPVAIVTGTAAIEGTADGNPMTGTFRYTRVYQHLAGLWKITNFEATRVPRHFGSAADQTTAQSPRDRGPHRQSSRLSSERLW